MRKKILCSFVVLSFMMALPLHAQTTEQNKPETDGLIVTFDDSVSDKKVEQIVDSADGNCEAISDALEGKKAAEVSAADEEAVMEELNQSSAVIDVQPNYVYYPQSLTDDPYTDESCGAMYQYYLDQLDIGDTWNLLDQNGGSEVKVGIVDSGFDIQHEDLQENLLYKDYYMQFANGSSKKTTDYYEKHGTHVSGIVGAAANNGKGGSGIASGSNNNYIKMILASASADGSYFTGYDMANALDYLADEGAQVINMSIGGAGYDYYLHKEVEEVRQQGIIVVVAAGNDSSAEEYSPAGYDDVITVSASNHDKGIASFSDYGMNSDIMAPGVDIVSTIPGDKYQTMNGTSMASPVTTGIVALMLYANPDLTFQQVYNIICGTASGNKNFDSDTAYGLIDPYNCVEQAYDLKNHTETAENIITKTDTITVDVGTTVPLKVVLEPLGSNDTITYTVEDDSIAQISDYNMVYGIYPGTTSITISAGNVTKTVNVKVTGSTENVLKEISPSQETITVAKGKTVEMKEYFNFAPYSFTGFIIYKSDDDQIAFMEDDLLTALENGTCNITATAINGLSATIQVVVKDPVHSVTFTSYKEKMNIGDTASFTAVARNAAGTEDVCDSGIIYTSSNESVAKISEDGTVTAVKAGTCYIYAQSKGEYDDPNTEYCKIAKKLTVVDPASEAVKNYKNYNLKSSYVKETQCKLSWTQCSSAIRYRIYRKTGSGSYQIVATAGKTGTYLDQTLKAGTSYTYLVRGYASTGVYSNSKAITILTPFTGANYNLKVKNRKLTWTKAPAATAYQIQRKVSGGSFVTIAKVKAVSSYKDKKASTKKKYKYRIRGICGKTYMGWSVIK